MAKRPKSILVGSIPETYIMDISDPEYFEEALCDLPEARQLLLSFLLQCHHEVQVQEERGVVWIAKPSVMNQGTAVVIFDQIDRLRTAVEEAPGIREWVVQRYVHPPLLIRQRKFHIRTYVLCIGHLKVYTWKEMLLLSASTYRPCLQTLVHYV